MFTVSIIGPGDRELARAESRPGETLRSALPRIVGDLAGDGVRRTLLFGTGIEQEPHERRTGRGVATVIREAGPRDGMTYPVERVRFVTDPPQI